MRDRWTALAAPKQLDQWLAALILIIAAIITSATRSGGEPGTQSYIESQKQEVSRIASNQFCLDFARSISGTVIYKENIYQDCLGG